jgi:hypothetical protein
VFDHKLDWIVCVIIKRILLRRCDGAFLIHIRATKLLLFLVAQALHGFSVEWLYTVLRHTLVEKKNHFQHFDA